MGENGKIYQFLGRSREWYRYQKLVPVPIVKRRSGTGTNLIGTGTDAFSNPVFAYYALLSLVFVHRLFRDPNKGLMGVHIRVYKRENIPYLDDIRLVQLIVQPLRVENCI